MSESNEEWELSKENIQPIQQGRKQKVLKVALASHPEEFILQQRQTFEHELRTYSGDDPLSVWCKYIKWVDQNFPKGGREGQIKLLIEQCLSILKDEKRYYDDDRFITILLKFANINVKPLEVYNYMYSNSIGCKSANFFISWSWELEQLGNFKKADEILTEGIQRRAEPFEKLKSYQNEFAVRLASKIKEGLQTGNYEAETARSAFSMLKPQKKNLAPVSRIGESVVNKRPLMVGRQQPQPRSVSASVKMPFKIYSSENITQSLPVQSHSAIPYIAHSETHKENEQKPSKWNKAKIKPHVKSFRPPSDVNPGFKFHCDDESEQISTPRSVTKTWNALRTRCKTPSPVMALFEPPDLLKMPMYPKNKVYGGAEEFSLEEIRAADWFETEKLIKQELLLAEQQKRIEEQARKEEELEKKIENLTKQVELLHDNFVNSKPVQYPFVPEMKYESNNSESLRIKNSESNKFCLNDQENKHRHNSENSNISNARPFQNYSQNIAINESKESSESMFCLQNNLFKSGCSLTDTSENKCIDSTSYRAAANMVQELYNKTLHNSVNEIDCKADLHKKCVITSDICFQDLKANHTENIKPDSNELKDSVPFTFYHDPTEVVLTSDICFQDLKVNCTENIKPDSNELKDSVPFTFYHDPTEVALASNNFASQDISKNECKDKDELVQKCLRLEKQASLEEDAENIPPKGYIQEKNGRELAGILEPSKNILFIPLEEQEVLQDDSDVEDELMCENKHFSDETLVPPSNTEQFCTAKFLASTPCASKNSNINKLVSTKSEVKPLNESVSQDTCTAKENDQNSSVKQSVNVQHTVIKPIVRAKEIVSFPGLPNLLSAIMETSCENYSKSSSSSSSSVNLTKSSHLDPSLSHFSTVRNPHLKAGVTDRDSVSKIPISSSGINSYKSNIIQSINEKKCDENFEERIYLDDPFDSQFTQKFLNSLNFRNYQNLDVTDIKKSIKSIRVCESVSFGGKTYKIGNLIAEGAYAKVYEASKLVEFKNDLPSKFEFKEVALKVCKNGNEWEFYICCEIQKRLEARNCLPDIKNSVMNVILAKKYCDGIVLVNEYSNNGTLLDIVNFYRKTNSVIPELTIMYLTLKMLHIVSKLHEINIIHGDIKADNFLIMNDAFCVVNESQQVCSDVTTSPLRLIDFGRAIDLNLHEKGICFTKTLSTAYSTCTEMKENKPWVFQLDWYGVLNCIHTMLFSEYMKVRQSNSRWGIVKKFKRYWFTSLWEPLFDELLNIPKCYQEPNVKLYIDMIESKLQQNSKNFLLQLYHLKTSYPGRKKNSGH